MYKAQDKFDKNTVTTIGLNNSKHSKRKTAIDFHQSGTDDLNVDLSKL